MATPLLAQRLPSPNGSSTIGEKHQLVRHVEQADRVLGVDVVGVLRLGRRAREEVRLAELVVLQTAEGVVDATAPAVADALLELEHRGVVLALARRCSGASGRCGTAGTAAAADCAAMVGAGDVEALTGRQAEERVRHLLAQRGAERQVARIDLVDVEDAVVRAAEAQVAAGGARRTRSRPRCCPAARARCPPSTGAPAARVLSWSMNSICLADAGEGAARVAERRQRRRPGTGSTMSTRRPELVLRRRS